MLKDETLLADACQLIQEQHLNAEWAVHKVMGRLRSFLDVSEDEYMKERRNDIDFVGERIVKNLVGKGCDGSELQTLQSGTIVIAHDLTPADTAVWVLKKSLDSQRRSAVKPRIPPSSPAPWMSLPS